MGGRFRRSAVKGRISQRCQAKHGRIRCVLDRGHRAAHAGSAGRNLTRIWIRFDDWKEVPTVDTSGRVL